MNENYNINQNKTFSANNLVSKSRYVEIKKHFIRKTFAYLIISYS